MVNFFQSIGNEPNVLWVLLGVSCICISGAVLGTFVYLQKRALIGDAIAHAILPGVCLAFMMFQVKSPLIVLAGAFAGGYLGLLTVNAIGRYTRIKPDAALGIVLSAFYGLGVVLLTMIQQSGNASQSGLDRFLLGKAAALVPEDVWVLSIGGAILVAVILAMYTPLAIISFDKDYAIALGMPVRRYEQLFSLAIVFAVAIGIQAVGVVLMAALLITPAVAARYVSRNLSTMMIIAVATALVSGIGGSLVSYAIPRMPTGPWIVAIASLLALLALLLGREKGLLFQLIKSKAYKRKVLHENLLKCMYQLYERQDDFQGAFTRDEMMQKRELSVRNWRQGMRTLMRRKWAFRDERGWGLTALGIDEGRRVVRIHRLWELYLTNYLDLPADHVHDNADAIEHMITPEIERSLQAHLNFPDADPHNRPIPK